MGIAHICDKNIESYTQRNFHFLEEKCKAGAKTTARSIKKLKSWGHFYLFWSKNGIVRQVLALQNLNKNTNEVIEGQFPLHAEET